MIHGNLKLVCRYNMAVVDEILFLSFDESLCITQIISDSEGMLHVVYCLRVRAGLGHSDPFFSSFSFCPIY